MQKSHQEIEINNLGAQLKKLKTKTAQAIEQTREVVEVKEGYLQEVASLEKELAEKTQELGQVLSRIKAAEDQEKHIKTKTERLQDKFQSDLDSRHEHLEKVNVLIKDKEVEKSNLQKEIDEINSQISQMDTEKEKLEDLYVTQLQELGNLIQTKKEELKTYTDNITQAVVSLSNLVDETVSQEQVLEEKKSQIKQREKELREISEDHSERSRVLDNKEKDIKVIEKRIKKEYENIFPNRKLNI